MDSGTASDGGCTQSCLAPTPELPAARAYIGPGGVDPAGTDCSGGSRQNPWKTWSVPRAKGCIKPGDAIYLMAGTYEQDGGVFEDGRKGTIKIYGEEGRTTFLAADPEAPGLWPVRLRGNFWFYSAWAEIRGIEFESDGAQGLAGYPVSVFGKHTTLRHNYIHGLASHFNLPGVSYDCLKISGYTYGAQEWNELSEGIQVIDNEIATCTEDGIDIASPGRNLIFRGNHIYGCTKNIGIQVKGGATGVLIEGNRIHDVRIGIAGMGGNCVPSSHGPCSVSSFLSTLPMADRYMASNVTVQNNVLYAISSNAIEPRGWRQARIVHNSLFGIGESALRLKGATWEFHDVLATEYCAARPQACDLCQLVSSYPQELADCRKIWITSRDVEVKNNIVVGASQQIVSGLDVSGLTAAHNVYFSMVTPLRFNLVDDVGRQEDMKYSLADFPFEHESYAADPGFVAPDAGNFALREDAFARDRGVPVGVECDIAGNARCDLPDLGAHEVQR